MNESISKQLTDPHKNKEQFVHEMTEVYLLLENEFNHLALSGAVYKDELDIPDMSTVQLKNSENPIKTMMAPLSIEDGAEIHLSSLKIEKNNIEPSSVEFSATQKFSCPSFSLILPDNNQELSTDVPEVSIIVKNSDDCIGKVNTNLSYVETGTFKYRAKRLTDIVPEKISLNKFSIIKDIIGDKHTYSQDCELSPLVCPTNIIEIKFSCKNENIDVDVLNSCKIFNIDVPLSTLKKTFGMFPLVMNYTPVKIIGAPDIIGFFSSNSIKKRRVIENTSISLSSAFIQIPSEYFPELCMRDSQETEVQNTAIMVPESKVDISFGKTVGQKYKPVSIGMLNVSSELIELKAISTKNFEFPHIDLNLTTNSGVVPTISKIRTITCKQELMFDGNKVNSINIHNNVLSFCPVRRVFTVLSYRL